MFLKSIIVFVTLTIIFGASFGLNTKLLVTTGLPEDEIWNSEIIDLLHPNVTCDHFEPFPISVYGAVGGLVGNNKPLVCGGWNQETGGNKKCFIVENELIEITEQLLEERYFGASVVHNGKLWITGGAGSPKTSEWIGLNEPPTQGPELPMNFVNHCMTRINETHVILVGGIDNNGQTLIVDVANDFKMTAGPNLKYARSGHACGTYSTPYGNQIVVAGGEIYLRDNYTEIFLKSTEIWNPAVDKDWLQGPDLPTLCNIPSMVTPDALGVVLMGCITPDNRNIDPNIYELVSDGRSLPYWRTMPQKFQFPRTYMVAMALPDVMANCH